ncbi:MAG: hypothetical protein AAGI08_01210 [Bacteroidota bacterium]
MRTVMFMLAAACISFLPANAQDTTNTQEGAQIDPEALPILEAHVEAMGGQEAIDGITAVRKVSLLTIETFGLEVLATRTEDKETGRFLNVTEQGGSSSTTGFDGERVWMKNPRHDGYLEAGDPMRERLLNRSQELSAFRDGGFDVARLPDSTLSGQPVFVLRTTRVDDPEDVQVHFIAQDTHLPVQRYTPSTEATLTYEAFTTVDGVTYPEMTKFKSARQSSTTQLIEIEHNFELEAGLFDYSA